MVLGFFRSGVDDSRRHEAACKLQKWARTVNVINRWRAALEVYSQPTIELARKRWEALLPRHPVTGEKLPLKGHISQFDQFGAGVAAYMHAVVHWGELFSQLFLYSLANLVTNVCGGALGAKINLFNIASIANAGDISAPSYGVIEFVCAAQLVRFIYKFTDFLKAQDERIDAEQVTPADFCVQLTGLPRTTEDDSTLELMIKDCLDKQVSGGVGKISRVAICRDNRDAILLMQDRAARQARRSAAVLGVQKERNVRTRFPDSRRVKRLADESYRQGVAIAAISSELAKLARTEKRNECSGTAFVSFESSADPKRLLRGGGKPTFAWYGKRYPLKLKRAPEPSDVIWENTPTSKLECGVRQLLGTLLMLIIALSGTVLITIAQYLMPSLQANAASAKDALLVQVVATCAIIAGNLPIFMLVPIIENTLLRHKTFDAKEVSIMLKLTFFQVFNTVCASASFLCDSGGELNHLWYERGAPLILSVLLGDSLIIGLGVDLFQPAVLIGRKLLAPTTLTQYEMDQIYAAPADIYLAFRLQLMCKFMVLTIMFSSALPGLYLMSAFLFFCAPVVDRWNLLRNFVPPAKTDSLLVRTVVKYVLPIATFLHLYLALRMYTGLGGEGKAFRVSVPLDELRDVAGIVLEAPDGSPRDSIEIESNWTLIFIQLSGLINGAFLLAYVIKEWFGGKYAPTGLASGFNVISQMEHLISSIHGEDEPDRAPQPQFAPVDSAHLPHGYRRSDMLRYELPDPFAGLPKYRIPTQRYVRATTMV